MRKLLLLLCVITIAFTSCDGRKTNNQSLTESIEVFKMNNTIVKVSYIPEHYIERKTDTVLSNAYAISIKTYTDMDSNIIKSIKTDTIHYNSYYRNVISQINIKQKNDIVFHQIIDKAFISSHTDNADLLDKSILQGVWLNQALSLQNDAVVIDLRYCEPKKDRCLMYQLYINKNSVTVNRLKENYYL
jgi:hypothetical protein